MNEVAEIRLLDFLYADHERVASFLSQINGAGNLRETQDGAVKSQNKKLRGAVNAGFIDAGVDSDLKNTREVRQTYDPLWTNTRKLIYHIEENGQTSSHRLGQVKVVTGNLLAYDLSYVSHMMQSDSIVDFIASGMKGENSNTRNHKIDKDRKRKEASVAREVLRAMPLGIAFILCTNNAHFWFNVKKQYLSLYDLDIPLKFPLTISGEWNVLGVVDALPHDHISDVQSIIDRGIVGMVPEMVVHMLQLIAAQTQMFGRPLPAYGLSPLAVYRQVSH